MSKRRLMLLGSALTLLMLVGAVFAIQSSVHAMGHATPATAKTAISTAVQTQEPTETKDQAGDTDQGATCATDSARNQTGDCQDSQNTSGPEDTAGSADAPGATSKTGP
jgi:hypothetical protein